MAQFFDVHPQNPQPRLMKQAGQLLANGGLVAVPTDSSYALVARLDDKAAADALRRLRGLDERHHLTLLCRDLAERSEEHTSELQSLMRISYAVFCLQQNKHTIAIHQQISST